MGCEKVCKEERTASKKVVGCTRGVSKGSGGQQKTILAVKKMSLKPKLNKCAPAFPASAVLHFTGSGEGAPYMVKRCKKHNGRTIQQCLGMKYADSSGNQRSYGVADLRYDIKGGRL